MLVPKVSVDNIKDSCHQIVHIYNEQCQPPPNSHGLSLLKYKLFDQPGPAGIQRKIRFLNLIITLDDKTGNDTADTANAILKLYTFYDNNSPSSRLIILIKDYLINLLDIRFEIPPTLNANIYASAIAVQDQKLQDRILALKNAYQFNEQGTTLKAY